MFSSVTQPLMSLQADDGYLYPLERAFFYVHKPPLLLLHEDVESVEFCRQGGGGAASTKTFDLAIRDRADNVGILKIIGVKALNIQVDLNVLSTFATPGSSCVRVCRKVVRISSDHCCRQHTARAVRTRP